MNFVKSALVLAMLGSCLQAGAQSPMVVTVDAQSNIFYAGTGLTPPSGQCTTYFPYNGLGNGTYPPELALPAGVRSLQIAAVNTSDIRYGMPGEGVDPVKTPDGKLYAGTTVSRNPSGTMPGLALAGRYGMLAAVFLDNNLVTTGGAVSLLTYTPAQMNAAGPLSYGLAVPFFIGDGSVVDWPVDQPSSIPDGTQQRQTISVPANATRIFFGLADAAGVNGDNTCYGDNSGAVLASIAMAVSDDAGTVAAGVAATAIADVRTNDYLNGAPPTAPRASVAAKGTWPAGITLDPASGAVKVAATVAAGDYVAAYTLCDTATSPASCADAQVTVHVTAVAPTAITATPDTGSTSTSGGQAIANVRANDTLGGVPATDANSTIAVQGIWPSGIALDPVTGAINVASGTAAGSYTVAYKLCERAVPSNCATTNALVQVNAAGAPAIDAEPDDMSVSPTSVGLAGNVLANDSLDGAAATPATVTIAPQGSWPAGVVLDAATGNVRLTAPLPVGTYHLLYQICQASAPANCASAVVTLRSVAAVPANGPVSLALMAIVLAGAGAVWRKRR